jgi:hypothetical protein
VVFPPFDLPPNATVEKAELYLRNRHSYSASGLTVYIGAHIDENLTSTSTAGGVINSQTSADSVPPGRNFAGANDTMTVNFAKGQGKWVTLPADWYEDIASGTVAGVLIGLTGVTNTWYSGIANYGYFDGDGMTDEPKLRITYQYLEGA